MPALSRQWWTRKCLLSANVAAPLSLFATGFRNPWLMGAATLIHTAFASAVVRPGCDWFGEVVTHFEPHGREVWLTLDDGPAGAATRELAVELRACNVPATFFVKGRNLAADPAVARCLLDAGHTLGNHTDTHPSATFWGLLPSRLRREIDGCNAAMAAAGAPPTRWFRSPVGLKHTRLHPALAERGMRLIAWNVRGCDGIAAEPEDVARRVIAGAQPGAIILLHEGRPRSNETILRVVRELQTRGFAFTIPSDARLR